MNSMNETLAEKQQRQPRFPKHNALAEEYRLFDPLNEATPTGVSVCVIGGGFVGLVTAVGLSQIGHNVTCVEKLLDRVSDLKKGDIPLFEQGVPEMVRANINRNRLQFTADFTERASAYDLIIITVGTPPGDNGEPDLNALREVVTSLAGRVRSDQIIIIKSTVPVGTARWIAEQLKPRNGSRGGPHIISNPEFLREGTALYDFFHPDRIVIGGESPEIIERVVQCYRAGMTKDVPIVATSNETAEMVKYASNVYLATRLSFVNELAAVCDGLALNFDDVAYAMGLDRRIGTDYLDAGPGFGGSCLPKDLEAYRAMARQGDVTLSLSPAVSRVNEQQVERVVEKIRGMVGGALTGARIGALGLSFKAQTDDLRCSPAIAIIRVLLAEGASVTAFDPVAMSNASRHFSDIALCDRAEDVATNADAIVVLTEWPEFQTLDWDAVKERMRQPNIIDARNLLDPDRIRRHGFQYVGMGRR